MKLTCIGYDQDRRNKLANIKNSVQQILLHIGGLVENRDSPYLENCRNKINEFQDSTNQITSLKDLISVIIPVLNTQLDNLINNSGPNIKTIILNFGVSLEAEMNWNIELANAFFNGCRQHLEKLLQVLQNNYTETEKYFKKEDLSLG